MTTYICTARVRHGSTDLTATGRGDSRGGAFMDAVLQTNAGYRSSPDNVEGALELLDAHERGDLSVDSNTERKMRGAYLTTDDDGYPVVDIGWVTYTWTRPVRLWQITAHVNVHLTSGYESTRQVPTFYLDPAVQGTLDEHAAIRVAHDILSTAGPVDGQEVSLSVSADPVY